MNNWEIYYEMGNSGALFNLHKCYLALQ